MSGAVEVGVRRVGDRAVGVERHGAVRRRGDRGDGQRVAVRRRCRCPARRMSSTARVLGGGGRCRPPPPGASLTAVTVIVTVAGVGQRAVADRVGEAVGAVVVGGRRVGAACRRR